MSLCYTIKKKKKKCAERGGGRKTKPINHLETFRPVAKTDESAVLFAAEIILINNPKRDII